MDYTLTFNVVAKSQSINDDGSTRYTSNLQATSTGMVGNLTISTDDPTVDAGFAIGEAYSASLVLAT